MVTGFTDADGNKTYTANTGVDGTGIRDSGSGGLVDVRLHSDGAGGHLEFQLLSRGKWETKFLFYRYDVA